MRRYTFFVILRATPAWLRLSRAQRRVHAGAYLAPAIEASGVSIRHFDAEAFTGTCSDVMMVETDDPAHHYGFMERLRDTPLLHEPYFDVLQIIPAIEDGYRDYEGETRQAP